jgi:hypothetical protein
MKGTMTDDMDEDEEIRLRSALAVALLALDLMAKEILRPQDAATTLDVIEEKYGFTPKNT